MMDLNAAKTAFALRRGDDALVLTQRLAEWCGHGPELELDIALTNLSLDLLGQARLWLSLAGELEGRGRDEDVLALRRDAYDFVNALLVEQENGDWGQTILRQFLFAAYQQPLLAALSASPEPRFAEIAAKSQKENAYALRFSADWVERLGDGTDESRARMLAAVSALWPFTAELFVNDAVDQALIDAGVGVDFEALRAPWLAEVEAVFVRATLPRPAPSRPLIGGRAGRHTEHLGHLLAEMQFLQRAYPDARW